VGFSVEDSERSNVCKKCCHGFNSLVLVVVLFHDLNISCYLDISKRIVEKSKSNFKSRISKELGGDLIPDLSHRLSIDGLN